MVRLNRAKVGMVGAGRRAKNARYKAEIHGVKIVIICDLLEDQPDATAEKYGVDERFTDFRVFMLHGDIS